MKIIIFAATSRVGKWATIDNIMNIMNIPSDKKAVEFYEIISDINTLYKYYNNANILGHTFNKEDNFIKLCKNTKDNNKVIYLYRKNKKNTYISMMIAGHLKNWTNPYDTSINEVDNIIISKSLMNKWIENQTILEDIQLDILKKNNIDYFKISYEELYESKTPFDVWKNLFKYLNVSLIANTINIKINTAKKNFFDKIIYIK